METVVRLGTDDIRCSDLTPLGGERWCSVYATAARSSVCPVSSLLQNPHCAPLAKAHVFSVTPLVMPVFEGTLPHVSSSHFHGAHRETTSSPGASHFPFFELSDTSHEAIGMHLPVEAVSGQVAYPCDLGNALPPGPL